MNLTDIRLNYAKGTLDKQSVGNDPIKFFEQWLQQAITSLVSEPTAMILSTVDNDGRPGSRVVLLKELKDNTLVFFTNYHSAKGRQIELNPNVSALFFWHELERQVRINGVVSQVPSGDSDAYFNSRPRESRIGAVISPQSKAISGREVLEKDYMEMMSRGEDYIIQRPDHWGGYAIAIQEIEFWQGRPGRLHDRIRFRQQNDGSWIKERLAP